MPIPVCRQAGIDRKRYLIIDLTVRVSAKDNENECMDSIDLVLQVRTESIPAGDLNLLLDVNKVDGILLGSDWKRRKKF